MTINESKLKQLIEKELSSLSDDRVIRHVRSMLIEPKMRLRHWDWGEPGTRYQCWDILEEQGGLGIAYSEYGFGPKCPWGLVRVSGMTDEYSLNIGMDCAWYPKLLDAYFESAAEELDIWRVFKKSADEPFPGKSISEESDWRSIWQAVYKLRAEDEQGAEYNVYHSVIY